MSLLLVRYRFRGRRAAQRADRPAGGRVAGGGRARPDPGLRPANGWFGAVAASDRRSGRSTPCPASCSPRCSCRCRWSSREVVPVLEEIGIEQEQAAPQSLGASALAEVLADHPADDQWAVAYGVVLSLARCARRVRCGQDRVRQRASARPRRPRCVVEQQYQNFDSRRRTPTSAFVSSPIAVVVHRRRGVAPAPTRGGQSLMGIEVRERRQAVRRLRRRSTTCRSTSRAVS